MRTHPKCTNQYFNELGFLDILCFRVKLDDGLDSWNDAGYLKSVYWILMSFMHGTGLISLYRGRYEGQAGKKSHRKILSPKSKR